MLSILEELVEAANDKIHASLEAWLIEHMEHWPGPSISSYTSRVYYKGTCSCGSSIDITLVLDTVMRHG